jgi:hypothetical protein
MLALVNLSATAEGRQSFSNVGGVQSILTMAQDNMDKKAFVEEVVLTLTRLCGDDDLSSAIAEQGMHTIMSVIDRYNADPEFLTVAFRLLGHLAFVETNLTIIVQHDGIQKVIQAIAKHPDCQRLMVRSIQTIDNIAMVSKENTQIVIDSGGKDLINAIMETYRGDEEIQRYGDSALRSMTALESLSKTAKAFGSKAKAKVIAAPEVKEDPLEKHRHLLSAGQVVKVWTKGTPKPAHLLLSQDFRSIVWQDPAGRKKLGALDLGTVVSITKGPSDGHKKKAFSRKTAEPECCFSIRGERTKLDLETSVKPEASQWVTALETLVQVYKTQPDMLSR